MTGASVDFSAMSSYMTSASIIRRSVVYSSKMWVPGAIPSAIIRVHVVIIWIVEACISIVPWIIETSIPSVVVPWIISVVPWVVSVIPWVIETTIVSTVVSAVESVIVASIVPRVISVSPWIVVSSIAPRT